VQAKTIKYCVVHPGINTKAPENQGFCVSIIKMLLFHHHSCLTAAVFFYNNAVQARRPVAGINARSLAHAVHLNSLIQESAAIQVKYLQGVCTRLCII